MESKKSKISVFSNRRNPLDNVVGRVPFKSLLLGFGCIFALVVVLIAGASQIEYSCVSQGELFIENVTSGHAQGRIKVADKIDISRGDVSIEVKGTAFEVKQFANEAAGKDGGFFYDITIPMAGDNTHHIPVREQTPAQISTANCHRNFLKSLLQSYF